MYDLDPRVRLAGHLEKLDALEAIKKPRWRTLGSLEYHRACVRYLVIELQKA